MTTSVPPPAVGQCLPPPTLLCGPGPANVSPRVLQAMAMNTLGHLHAPYTKMMDETKELIQYVFQTKNQYTFAIDGSGAACMEALLYNCLERGEKLLLATNGYWGNRMQEVASRAGIEVVVMERKYGDVLTVEEVKESIEKHKPQGFFLVHGESSVGVAHPLSGMGDICRANDCLFLVDAVVTAGGMPLLADEWKIDAMYSGGQKCLGAPPGLSPISFGERAMAKINNRKSKISSYYFDALIVGKYWGCSPEGGRVYHHTGSIHNVYALRESLRVIAEETLEKTWARHAEVANLFYAGLEKLGLSVFVENMNHRLLPLTLINIPEGVDGAAVAKYMMTNYNIEIAGGLGSLAGKVWRVGFMGYNARNEVCIQVLAALEASLKAVKGQ